MSHNPHSSNTLAAQVEKHTGVSVARCYQCGKCSASCPVNSEADFPPSLLLRMLQNDDPVMDEQVLRSSMIWLCLSCEMCISRCPMEVDIPKVSDYLRYKSMEEKKTNPAAKSIIAFHKAFLSSIKNTGRLYEVGLTVNYKLHTGALMQDTDSVTTLLSKGKLNIFPERIKDKLNMKRIFSRTLNKK